MTRAGTLAAIVACFGCGALYLGEVEADPARAQTAPGDDAVPPTDGDWPAYRGPHRNGLSTESDWQTEWPAEGPKRLWSAEVGLGYACVSVAGGKAATLGNRDGEETVYCFDAETGRELWKHSYRCGLVDNLHLGGPGASPTFAGERVFTLSKEGQLHAFDVAGGRVLWNVDLRKQCDVPLPEWGFTSSPLVLGDKLLLDVGGLAAFDVRSGAVIWRGTEYRAGYGSPVVLSTATGAVPLVAQVTNDCLIVVRGDDGREIAKYDWTSQYVTTATTPIVRGKTIFLSTGYGGGCALLEFDGARLAEIYRNDSISTHMNTPVLRDGRLYGIDGNSHTPRQCKLVCLDLARGERTWEQRGFGCGALMLADGKLLVLSDEGYLTVAHAAPDGYREIAKTKVFDDHTWTMPVLSHGRIYCRSESGHVVCLDVRRR